ncbi:hypothetical protein EmuJ_000206200 [Echinococcus multilocularis]|uniref:Uncharacterized protein n=1 Tax=Echinococcus multilocularis TaxID=6211 RepID=A0A087VWF7_ECHMU|nr:hypothetical protein EmuJ_000013000 [Echinococcus multilocularis]CDI98224.1 hypothetical protein EmuJ_000206200 [Echinococcus multilocularis]
MRRKLLTMRLRRELMTHAKQRVIEARQSKSHTEHGRSRRLLRPSPNAPTHSNLTEDEFQGMKNKLIDNLISQDNVYNLIESALQDLPNEAAVQRMATILGSHVHLHQYLVTFKQPKHLLPYVIHVFGGSDKAFQCIDKALMGDLWSIYRIAKCMAFDLKATVRLLTSIERTVGAAASCLTTRPCHFHYVEDFINLLLRREWTEADLVELANGRYEQNLKPGEKPNRNPLLAVATGMSENEFLRFYKALHELDYRYFKSLDSVQYEQSLCKS